MGFFKNLIKGDFKKIGKNFANNIAEGRLVKGTGFDSVINTAANVYTGGTLAAAGAVLPDRIGDGLFGATPRHTQAGAIVQNAAIKLQKIKQAQAQQAQAQAQGGFIPPKQTNSMPTPNGKGIDINNDGKDDTLWIGIGAAIVGYLIFKNRK